MVMVLNSGSVSVPHFIKEIFGFGVLRLMFGMGSGYFVP